MQRVLLISLSLCLSVSLGATAVSHFWMYLQLCPPAPAPLLLLRCLTPSPVWQTSEISFVHEIFASKSSRAAEQRII